MKIVSILARVGLLCAAFSNLFRILIFIDKGLNSLIITYLLVLEISILFSAFFTMKLINYSLKYRKIICLTMAIGLSYPLVKKLESGTWDFFKYPIDIEYILVPVLVVLLIFNNFKRQKNA